MSDLTLQDFRDPFNEGMGQVLSDEKQKMFGAQKSHAKKRRDNHSSQSSFADSLANVKEDGT
jgi:hypothetical protein